MSKTTQQETVMDHLVEAVPTAHSDDAVETVLRHLRSGVWQTLNYVYILDNARRLIGVVSVRELLAAKNEQLMRDLMTRDVVIVHPHADQERASIIAIQHGIKAVPIVRQGSDEFLGVVGADQVLKILHEEHTEDFLRMSGIQRGHPIIDELRVPLFRLVRLRLFWLVIGFIGGLGTILLSGYFEATLSRQIAIAFYVPLIVYLSSAVGAQTTSLYIRNVTIRPASFIRYAIREGAVGLMLAIFFGTLIYCFTWFWQGDTRLALMVGLAMSINLILAPFIALSTPALLYAFKKDPAIGAGPFSTVISDFVSLLVYFIIASWLLL